MIIDGHVHIAAEPDDAGFRAAVMSGPELIRHMDGPFHIAGQERRVDQAVVQPMITATRAGDPMDHHAYVVSQIEAYPDRLMGCFVANPFLEMERTLHVMRELVGAGTYKAIKLHPTGHGYMPFKTRDRLDPIVAQAGELGVPVIIHQGEPPFAHPSQVATLIEDFPKVTFILAHFGTQRVVLADEAILVARHNPNVLLETGWGHLPRLKEGIAAIGSERLVFGSDCPIQEIGSQLRTLEVLGWGAPMGIGLSRQDVEGMMGDNWAALLSRITANGNRRRGS